MANRKRNIRLGIWLAKDERELLKKVSTIKGLTITDLIVEWAKKDYEKLMKNI